MKTQSWSLALRLMPLCALIVMISSCEKKAAPAAKRSTAAAVDLSNWKADPNLPKPVITATVAIVKEPEKKKISMRVTAKEANKLTVHEVQIALKYRVLDKEKGEYVYPEKSTAYKMIPKIDKGEVAWQTPIVESYLRDKAWEGTDDNWEIEVRGYNQYYKE
jgi:hypothetical protein